MPTASASVVKARFGVDGGRMSLLSPVMYAANRPYGTAAMSFEPMYLDAYAGQLTPSVTGGNLVIYPLGMWGHGITGGVGQGDFSFEPVIGLASGHEIPEGGVDPGVYNYGEGRLTLPRLTMTANSVPAEFVFMTSAVSASSDVAPEPTEVLLVMNSTMQAVGVMTFETVMDGDARSAITFITPTEAEALLGASIMTVVAMLTDTTVFNTQAAVYCVNRLVGSTTRYENYDFTRYIRIDGFNYGVKSDGVYLIGGETDDGLEVRSSMDFGKKNFGSTAHKMLRGAYVGLESNGGMQLRVVDDTGVPYFYKLAASDGLNTKRVDLGRGLKANYYSLQLYNEGGADFDIADIEFEVAESTRRI